MSLSDDEAPEEIALSTGRSQAAALRSQEQAQRTQQSVSKSKRKRKSDDGRLTPGSIQRTGVSVEEQQQQDCVPDDVIAALTAANKYGKCSYPVETHILSTGTAWLCCVPRDFAKIVQLLSGLVPRLRPMTLQTSRSIQWYNLSAGNSSSHPSAQQVQLLSKYSMAASRQQHRQVLQPLHQV